MNLTVKSIDKQDAYTDFTIDSFIYDGFTVLTIYSFISDRLSICWLPVSTWKQYATAKLQMDLLNWDTNDTQMICSHGS